MENGMGKGHLAWKKIAEFFKRLERLIDFGSVENEDPRIVKIRIPILQKCQDPKTWNWRPQNMEFMKKEKKTIIVTTQQQQKQQAVTMLTNHLLIFG